MYCIMMVSSGDKNVDKTNVISFATELLHMNRNLALLPHCTVPHRTALYPTRKKQMPRDDCAQPEVARKDLETEIDILTRLQHPNIVEMLGAGHVCPLDIDADGQEAGEFRDLDQVGYLKIVHDPNEGATHMPSPPMIIEVKLGTGRYSPIQHR